MIKVGYINPTGIPSRAEFNYHWMLFKCFYEDYGKYPEKVTWVEPIFKWNEVTIQDCLDNVKGCSIVFFTNYVWIYKINQRIRNGLDSDTIVVMGGPQQDPDIIKDYDYVADPLAPGEIFVQYFLDMYLEDSVDKKKIPFYLGSSLKIPLPFGHTNVYKRCEDYFTKEYKHFIKNIDLYERITLIYESTRGCPFKCSYCEWGGGTGTKVLKKPMAVIKDEMEFIGRFKGVHIDLCDANTGMFKERDREMMMHMVDNGVQIGENLSVLKTLKLEQKKEMLDFMIEHDITRQVISISLQSISPEARKIANRRDLNVEETYELVDHLTNKWNNFKEKELWLDLELILAMPGSTLKDFYEEFKVYYRVGYNEGKDWEEWKGLDVWADTRYPYMVLPATETASKEYQEKYKIKTSKVLTQFDGNYSGKWDDVEVNPIYGDVAYEYDTIIECFSYTFEEYLEMFIMNLFTPHIGLSFISEYTTYENVSEVAKELWNILNDIPMFFVYKELIRNIFYDKNPHSIDKFDVGRFKGKDIVNEMKILLNKNEEMIKERLDEFCRNL